VTPRQEVVALAAAAGTDAAPFLAALDRATKAARVRERLACAALVEMMGKPFFDEVAAAIRARK
jgi:hypothetical protein